MTRAAVETSVATGQIVRELEESAQTKLKLKAHAETIAAMAQAIIESLRAGGKLVAFGNGGSAADAQHIVAELVGQFQGVRKGLPAVALTVNTSVLTAIGNDFAFEEIFARQVEALAKPEDVILAISTGGYVEGSGPFSKNVVRGVEEAKRIGAKTIGLLGKTGGLLATMVDIPLVVPSSNTQRIQEAHIAIGHIVCSLVEQGLMADGTLAS